MKINALIALICCILCSVNSLFAMHETQSTNELSSLENVDKETVFETISKPTKSTKTPKHRYSPRRASPLAHSTSASDLSNETPSELTLPAAQETFISQPTRPTPTRSRRHSPRTPSPLAHSSSTSNISDMPNTNVVEPGIRSAGLSIFMSVINNFSRPLTLQTTHTPLESDPNLLQLISEIEIQPGSHQIKGLFRLKKYGYGADEVAHNLTAIKFIDPTTGTILREITGNELRNSNEFFGIKLQPAKTSTEMPSDDENGSL